MTEIAIRQPSALTPAGIDFSQEQIETIKKTIARGASDTELDLFLAICRRTGLDPFLKQIHLIERRTKDGDRWITSRQPLVGIDGMRLVAKRTGNFDSVDIAWLNDDGEWSEVWKGHGVPVAAKATVYKYQGRPQTAICRYDSYVQTTSSGQPNSVWAKSPDNQIAKCAESLALRRSFPAEMSALAASVSINLEDTTAYEIEAGERTEATKQLDTMWKPIDEANVVDPDDLPFDQPTPEEEEADAIGEGIQYQGEPLTLERDAASTPVQWQRITDLTRTKWNTVQLLDNVAEHLGLHRPDFANLKGLTEKQAADVLGWLESGKAFE